MTDLKSLALYALCAGFGMLVVGFYLHLLKKSRRLYHG